MTMEQAKKVRENVIKERKYFAVKNGEKFFDRKGEIKYIKREFHRRHFSCNLD